MTNYFAKNIKYLRRRHDITQQDLAKKIGKTKNAVSNWEQGIRQPIVHDVITLCNYFNVSFTDLMETDLSMDVIDRSSLTFNGLSPAEKEKLLDYYNYIISQR